MIYKELENILKEEKLKGTPNGYIRNLLKEYLQIYVLYFIYTSSDYNKNLIFTGGTCLRHFFGLERLSEDIDFDYINDIEVLTVCNPQDGILTYYYLTRYLSENELRHVINLLKKIGGCSAGRKILAIDSEGNVHPCQFLTEINLGNVKTTDLRSILRSLESSEFHDLSKLSNPCKSCKFNTMCRGCRARALYYYGDTRSFDYECYFH